MAADPTDRGDVPAIRACIDLYCRSIDDADTELAARLWSQSDYVSFIHPRGHDRGFANLTAHFYEQTMEARFSERKLAAREIDVHVYGDAALAEFYWTFVARFREDGSLHRH